MNYTEKWRIHDDNNSTEERIVEKKNVKRN